MRLAMDEETGAVEIGWTDSWHQSSGVMRLIGDVSATSGAHSRFVQGGEETWGWTIDLTRSDGALSPTMANVTPQGETEWSVRTTYRRD